MFYLFFVCWFYFVFVWAALTERVRSARKGIPWHIIQVQSSLCSSFSIHVRFVFSWNSAVDKTVPRFTCSFHFSSADAVEYCMLNSDSATFPLCLSSLFLPFFSAFRKHLYLETKKTTTRVCVVSGALLHTDPCSVYFTVRSRRKCREIRKKLSIVRIWIYFECS